MLHPEIKKYLDELDETRAPLSPSGEYGLAHEIKKILQKDPSSYSATEEDYAEEMAFNFLADYPADDSGWGTYYGPRSVLSNGQGRVSESPSIREVNSKVLIYWAKRANESTNPILSSRYADLVVDLSKRIPDYSADITLFHLVIDSNITICGDLLAKPIHCVEKIKRALNLAINIKDKERVCRTKDAIIQLEETIAEDDKPGLWGFAFQWLVLDYAKKVTLTPQEYQSLIDGLEKRLRPPKENPWLPEKAVSLLSGHYARQKDEENLMRVLEFFENTLKADQRLNSDALLITTIYDKMHQEYEKHGSDFLEARKASKRLLKEIGQLELDWSKSSKKIVIKTKVTQEEINYHLKKIFGESKDNSLEMVMAQIAIAYFPIKNSIKKELYNASKQTPLQFLFHRQLFSEDNIPIAILPPLDQDDKEMHLQYYASQHTCFGSIYPCSTMQELHKKFRMEEVSEYFLRTTIFKNENPEYLKRSISAYWNEDYLVSSHLFIPLIESGIRELVKICKGSFLRQNSLGGYDYSALTGLFKNNQYIFDNVFQKCFPDILFYFQLILTATVGMNLRNDFAHGIGKQKFIRPEYSDRLFHILTLLSLIKEKED